MPRNEIDVVEDFVLDSSCDEYNKAYRLWRRSGPSKYVFRFTKHGGERVFIDGEGFVDITAAKVSTKVLSNISWIIGIILTFVLVCDTIGGSVLVGILRLFGISVQSSLLTMDMYGSQWAIVIVRMLLNVLKYLVPALCLIRCLRLPLRVFLPLKPQADAELISGVSAAILCGVFVSRLAELTGDQIFTRQLFYSYKDSFAVIVYAVFEVIVVSMLAELFFSGVLLQALRQFGDIFALLFVAGVAFLLPNELPYRIGSALIALISGYCMFRTGSMMTCFFIRVAYAIANFSQLLFSEEGFGIYDGNQITLLMMLVVGIGLIIGVLMHRFTKRKVQQLNRVEILTVSQKTDALFGSTTMLPWFACAVLLAIIQIVT